MAQREVSVPADRGADHVTERVHSGAIEIPVADKIVVRKANPGDMMIQLYPKPESTRCEFCMRSETCGTVRSDTKLMMGGIEAKNPQEAQAIFENLVEVGHKPSLVTYTVLLIALINQKRFDLIHPIISQVKDIKMKPDLIFYNAVVKAFSEGGNVDEGMKVFWEMKSVGIEPTTKTFNHLLYGHIIGGKYNESVNLLELMSKEDVEPDLRTCNLLVRALCHMNNIKEAWNVVGKMVNSGLKPDAFTCNTIAERYARNGDPKKGEEVVFEMRSHNVYTYQTTCGSIINAYCNEGNFKGALSFLYKMKDLGVRPNLIIFNSLIKRLLGVEDYSDCFDEVLTLMGEYGIEPDVITFSTIMNSWSSAGYMDKCRAIFDDMVKAGIEPDYHAYCILAKGYVQAGEPEKAQELVAPMIKSGIKLKNEVIFTTLISGWCHAGKMDNALYVFDIMCKYRVLPELQNFEFLIWGFVEAQQPWRAEEVIQRMKRYNMRPDRKTLALVEEAKAKLDGAKNLGFNGNEKKTVEFAYGNSVREKVSTGTSKQRKVVVRSMQQSCTFVCRKQWRCKTFMCGQFAQISKVGLLN